MANTNRIIWMTVFLFGVALFAWFEWQDNRVSPMVWFMLTSFWSAICAIGYTVFHWFLLDRKSS